MTRRDAEGNKGRQLGVCRADGGFSAFPYADDQADCYSEVLSDLSPSYTSHLLSDVRSHLGVRKVTSKLEIYEES